MKYPVKKLSKHCGNAEWIWHNYLGENDNGEEEKYWDEISELHQYYHCFHDASEYIEREYEVIISSWENLRTLKGEDMSEFWREEINISLEGLKRPIRFAFEIACDAQYINNEEYKGANKELTKIFEDLVIAAESIDERIKSVKHDVFHYLESYSSDMKKLDKGKSIQYLNHEKKKKKKKKKTQIQEEQKGNCFGQQFEINSIISSSLY